MINSFWLWSIIAARPRSLPRAVLRRQSMAHARSVVLGIFAAMWCGGALAAAQTTTDLTITIVDANAGNPTQGLEPVVYNIDATNAGAQAAPFVGVVVTLAAGLTFDTVLPSVPAWTCEQAVGVVVCTRPSLPAGTTESLTLVARAPAGPATLQTLATINSAATEPSIDNNIAIVTTDVTAAPAGAPTIEVTAPTLSSAARADSPRAAIAGKA